MSGQRHVILWSVVFAAVISPTPDAVNQLLLAAPIIVMYQVGIVIILLKTVSERIKNRKTVCCTRSVAVDNESAIIPQKKSSLVLRRRRKCLFVPNQIHQF